MRLCFMEASGASFDCASDTDMWDQGKKRALFGIPSKEFGQETAQVLDVWSSGVAVREETSNLAVAKEKPKSKSFFIHMRRTGDDAVSIRG